MSYLEHQAAYPPPVEDFRHGKHPDGASSITFVWERPDDETAVFSIEFGPSTPHGEPVLEEMGRATYDEHGTAGLVLLKETLEATAEAIGASWSER